MSRELLQQCLDMINAAIKSGDWKVNGACDPDSLIRSLKTELAKPEQAALESTVRAHIKDLQECVKALEDYPQFAATRLEICKAIEELGSALSGSEQDHGFDRTASHMASEYVDTAEQEPVALKMVYGEVCCQSKHDDQSNGMWCPITEEEFPNGTPFYTAPLRKEWVGLTDEQKKEATAICKAPWHSWAVDPIALCNYVEAKLKELNK